MSGFKFTFFDVTKLSRVFLGSDIFVMVLFTLCIGEYGTPKTVAY